MIRIRSPSFIVISDALVNEPARSHVLAETSFWSVSDATHLLDGLLNGASHLHLEELNA